MTELVRPQPRPTLIERAAGWLSFVGTGRVISAAGSIVIVMAGCWWLLRTPTPPIESGIPLASGVTAPGQSAIAGPVAPIPAPHAVEPGLTTTSLEPSLTTIVVQAAGAVAVPGVYSLPLGSRVHQLIAAAGGAAPDADLDALALASVMVDGQRIVVQLISDDAPPMPAPTPAGLGSAGGAPAASGTGSTPDGPIDINRASATELDTLPGVGPATATAIVAWRDANGPFGSPDDLLKVPGIGPAKLEAMRAQVAT